MCNEPLRTPFFTEHLLATAYARQRQHQRQSNWRTEIPPRLNKFKAEFLTFS